MYEFVLEYGSFPVKLIDGFVNNRSEIPDFLKEDEEMIARLNEINELFHQLFLTIECKFDYIGETIPWKNWTTTNALSSPGRRFTSQV